MRAGRPREARDLLSDMLDYVASSGDTEFLVNTLELSAAIAAELGEALRAARLAGAAEAIRQKAGMPITVGRVPARAVPGPGPRRHRTRRSGTPSWLPAPRSRQDQAIALLVSPMPGT